jgi:SAM-dependent methyltransferase
MEFLVNERPMSKTESHIYWIERHREYEGNWRSTGFLGGNDDINKAIYDCRFRALSRALSRHFIALSGKRVLDVGCGLGDFAGFYAMRGANVHGIDISPEAVAHCNTLQIGDFIQGESSEIAARFKEPFHLIHCFDVLYHLTDDTEWQAALASFAKLSQPETVWLFTEFHTCIGVPGSGHIVKRPIDRYKSELKKHGRQIAEEIPIYWLYAAAPLLARWFPWLMCRIDGFGRFIVPHLDQWVALWVIKSQN